MEAAVGAANWLLGKVLTKLSDDLVAAYMASSELGHNFHNIKQQLLYTQGLLRASQGRDVSDDPGLYGMLQELSKKADEAEDLLDELHYFMIKDQLDGTKEATPELGDGIRGPALHVRHAARHTIGNWISCFSCSRTQDGDSSVAVVTSNPQNATRSGSGNDGGPVDKLSFKRVDMSNKIKSVIEELNSMCGPVSDLLNHSSTATSTTITLKRPPTGSVVAQDKLYGRRVMFERTVNALTCGTYQWETVSVLPIIGPGGIGKTTFTQHLYNDERIMRHFTVRVWVCVSTDFDLIKLTREILSCIPATENEEYKCTIETANLDQLQKSIAERLKSTRFLIVLDDIWKCSSEHDWKNLLAPFRKGETKGNMVLVTTRFPSIAHLVKTTDPVEMHGLEPNDLFHFFEACIFGDTKPGQYEDDLIVIARDIAGKLKGSPLAAYTVGRLLKKNLSWEHWMGVLEKNEWQNAKNDDDIMPSLKLSYNYLPFHLKKCFSYCALFPEDYRFYDTEITHIWIAIGIIDSSCQSDTNHLEDLVDNGFLTKGSDKLGQYYVMHDLLHELSRNVSTRECINISSLNFSACNIPQSIRHLSITIEDIYDECFEEEMGKLKSRIDIGNLRTLMIFRSYDARIANILKDTFQDIKGLRVLFVGMSTPKSLPNNFLNLIHLQYLKITSPHGFEMSLPSSLSRFYHLKFLDLENWCGRKDLPKEINHLVNLRHFRSSKELHSNVPKVGMMKCLQELKEFYVKKESVGFELGELGQLTELGGELSLCNLETVVSKGEASAAKLKNKKNLKKLRLVWGSEHRTVDDDVLDGLRPHSNLRGLGIVNPGVAPCPSWLCSDISMTSLESLHLEGVSWGILPSFEQLPHLTILILKNVTGMRTFGPGFGGVTERSFMHLKTIVFENMPQLVEWAGGPNSHQFSWLESIRFKHCPFLSSFPFMQCSDIFTNLCRLDIDTCPKLSKFPLMPHTSKLTYISVNDGFDGFLYRLLFKRDGSSLLYDGKKLSIEGYTGALAFDNMDKVEVMKIRDVSHIPLSDLQKLNSLRSIYFERSDGMFSAELDDSVVLNSVQSLHIDDLCITGELFSKVLKCFPALSQLTIKDCKGLELLPVEDGGLSRLRMLQSLKLWSCRKMFSRWPKEEVGVGAHAIKPFPTSLRELDISFESSMQSMGLFSNLTSLTNLSLTCCRELTMDGFNPLITVNLKKLVVNTMYWEKEKISIAGDLLTQIAKSKSMQAGSNQLGELVVDSISAVLTAPICSHLAATLQKLQFTGDRRVTTFMEEQDQALQLLTSLKHLLFTSCDNLQFLPGGLRSLSSLKTLLINHCKKILCLPSKESLPTSLEKLEVMGCSPELTEQAKKLKETDPWFLVDVFVAG